MKAHHIAAVVTVFITTSLLVHSCGPKPEQESVREETEAESIVDGIILTEEQIKKFPGMNAE